MSVFRNTGFESAHQGRVRSRTHLVRVVGLLAALVLVLAACGSAATPTPPPAQADAPAAATATDAMPTPLPMDTPAPEVTATPSVTVMDQEVVDGSVTVAEVVSDGPGWLVIHAQKDGAPGPILGYSPVSDGANTNVMVAIDLAGATETLYAMLHTDAGQVGTWEFPGGPDAPVQVDGQVVTPPFEITGGMAEAVIPSVTVADQEVVDGSVTVAEVVSDGPGWLVIHAQKDGAPGPILGYSPVSDGANTNVMVAIDLAGATETLYAMLHTDAGQVGTWEFPGGPDAPVQIDGQVVTPPFTIAAAEGEVEVAMMNFKFEPATLLLKAGSTVTWVNKDGEVGHTTTSDTGLWDSGLFKGGESFTFTFAAPGVYPYYCIPHGKPGGVGMAGTVVVLP